MKINFKIILSFLLPATVLILFFFGLNNNNRYDTKNLVGKKITSFELKSLFDEGIIASNDILNNNYTLINFWASWCSPCRAEHRYLISLKQNSDLKIVGINFKDQNKNAIKFLNDLGNPYYKVLQDKNGKAAVKLGVYGIPESILIDSQKNIIEKFVGPINKGTYKIILKSINSQ